MPVVLFVGILLFWTFNESPARTLVAFMLIVVAAILSFLAPRWVLRFMAARRRQRVQHEVPLFIHLLVLLFESGLSTRQALARSEEHTSELQSLMRISYAVFCLKKKKRHKH